MLEQTFVELVSGRKKGLAARTARLVLRAVAVLWSSIVRLRNAAYDRSLLRTHRVPARVISVGNVTTGGTGKTPIVAAVTRLLQDAGLSPGIISRGYRADDDGFNDEKRVLDRLVPGVPHIQNPDRVAAASELLSSKDVDSLVLDDAFQHRRIGRDLDIVLIDATCPFGFGSVFPGGLLREPLSGLKRADLVLLTRCDLQDASELMAVKNRLKEVCRKEVPILSVRFRPGRLFRYDESDCLADVSRLPVGILTAIGNPSAFRSTCESLGASVVAEQIFPDHHHYTSEDLNEALRQLTEDGAQLVLTTRKDMVKLTGFLNEDSPVAAVEIAPEFATPAEAEIFRITVAGE